MKRQFLSLLLAVVLTLPAFARDFNYTYEGKTLFYTVIDEDAKTCMTRNGNWGDVKILKIPAIVNDGTDNFTVTAIEKRSFTFRSGSGGDAQIEEVYIPETVTKIGAEAFGGNKPIKLKFASLESFLRIEKEAIFYSSTSGELYINDEKYTSIEIPEGVTSIKDYQFHKFKDITTVKIPNSVTTIGEFAFYQCNGLTSIDLPSSVTTIGASAFTSCSGLTSIEIPNSVTTIGQSAFEYCSGLISIEIPNSVTTIGARAFSGCRKLTTIGLPSSITSISASVFWDCSGLTNIEIPNTVTTIGQSAFSGCSGLISIEIPSSVTSIGNKAFSNCTGLTSIILPYNITSIGDETFWRCEGLTSIDIPSAVTMIGASAFSGCSGLTNIEIPSKVTEIGASAFSGCKGLTQIEVPSGVTSIGNYAFSSCTGLTSIKIPSTVTTFGSNIISGCAALEELSILSTNFSTSTSVQLDNLKKAILPVSFLPQIASANTLASLTILPGDASSTMTLGLDAAKIIAPDNFQISNANVISYPAAGVVQPDGGAYNSTLTELYQCPNQETVEIPASVTSIAENAFENCGLTKTVSFADGMTSVKIGDEFKNLAFDNLYMGRDWTYDGFTAMAPSVKNVTFGPMAGNIPANAFNGSNNLTSITLPATVKTVGENAFANCANLTSIVSEGTSAPTLAENSFDGLYATVAPEIPDGALLSYINPTANWMQFASIAQAAHALALPTTGLEDGIAYSKLSDTEAVIVRSDSYAGMVKIDIPETIAGLTVVGIDMNAFASLPNLQTVTIPASVRTIGAMAFRECVALKSISLPAAVTEIPAATFYGCSALTEVNLDNVVKIGDEAFAGSALTIANLESSEAVGSKAFVGVPLTSVQFGASLASIGSEAFAGCPMTQVAVPDVKKLVIDNKAFAGCTSLTAVQLGNSESTTLGLYVFEGCTKLSSFTSEASLTSIVPELFKNCVLSSFTIRNARNLSIPAEMFVPFKSTLATVELGSGVVEVGASAFEGCKKLKSVTFGKDLTSIGYKAFASTFGATNSITFAENSALKTIGEHAFESSNIRSIKLPANVVSIGKNAFNSAQYLATVELSANKSLEIADSAFIHCSRLTSVVFPETIASIGTRAFSDVPALESIDVKADEIAERAFATATTTKLNHVSIVGGGKLGEYAFEGQTALTSAEVDIKDIGQYAFANLAQLKKLKLGSHIDYVRSYAFNGTAIDSICFPYVENPEAVTVIETEALMTTGLKHLSLGNRVKQLTGGTGYSRFRNITIDLGTSIETLQKFEFHDIQKIVIPASLKSWSGSSSLAAGNLSSVDSLIVEESYESFNFGSSLAIKYIEINRPFTISQYGSGTYPDGVFGSGPALAVFGDNSDIEIKVPARFNAIGTWIVGSSVKDIYSLTATTVIFKEGVETIQNLDNRYGNTELKLPASLKSINNITNFNFKGLIIADGDNPIQLPALPAAAKLENVYIGRDITGSVFNFNGLTKLQKAVIGDQVKTIADYMFKNCTALTNVVMSDNVSKIGTEAFFGCTGLEVLSLSENVTSIGTNAYSGCTGLQKIVARGLTPPEGAAGFSVDIQDNVPLYVPDEAFDDYADSDLFIPFAFSDHIYTFGGNVIESVETEPVDAEYTVGSIFQLLKPIVKWFVSKLTSAPAMAPAMMSAQAPATSLREVGQVAAAADNNADFDNFYWFAPNPEIASVDQEGNVTINGEGKAEIWVYALDGSDRKGVFAINDPDALTVSGDFNGDKVVNSSDLQFLINHVLNPQNSTLTVKQADMSSDGIVNSSDIQLHINKILNK